MLTKRITSDNGISLKKEDGTSAEGLEIFILVVRRNASCVETVRSKVPSAISEKSNTWRSHRFVIRFFLLEQGKSLILQNANPEMCYRAVTARALYAYYQEYNE